MPSAPLLKKRREKKKTNAPSGRTQSRDKGEK